MYFVFIFEIHFNCIMYLKYYCPVLLSRPFLCLETETETLDFRSRDQDRDLDKMNSSALESRDHNTAIVKIQNALQEHIAWAGYITWERDTLHCWYSKCWPASVAQWAETQCAQTGTVCRRSRVQSPGGPVDFVFGFQGCNGACFEINFSGRQRGFDGVLYNLWPLANIELSGAQLVATA